MSYLKWKLEGVVTFVYMCGGHSEDVVTFVHMCGGHSLPGSVITVGFWPTVGDSRSPESYQVYVYPKRGTKLTRHVVLDKM